MIEVKLLGRLDRGAPPVVPGPEPLAQPGAQCALCQDDNLVTYAVVGHADTVVCVDSRSCVLRALAGVRV